jgi:hypothetical protein
MEYIAIKNWDKYQSDSKGQLRAGYSPWIKDWVDKEADREYSDLTCLQRYLYDGLRRLRGKLGKNPANDPVWIGRILSVHGRERKHIPQAIERLLELGLITLSSQPLPNGCDTGDAPLPTGCNTAGERLNLETPTAPATSLHRVDKNREEKDKSNESLSVSETKIETVEKPIETPSETPVEARAAFEGKFSSTDQGLAAGKFFVLLGKPKALASSAGSWEKRIQPLLATVPLNQMEAIMDFAVTENDFSAEYLRLSKDPMASFVKNFEELERRYEAREAGLRAKAKTVDKIKSVGATKTAPGSHGNKSGYQL